MNFAVALLQIAPNGDDQDRNLAQGLESCREAKARGADLAVFPELWNIGGARCPVDAAGRRAWTASAIDQQSEFFQSFVRLAQDLGMNIAVTYLETNKPKPRNSVSIINHKGEMVLNYSKVFLCNFGEEELLKPSPNLAEIGCDFNCSPGDSFGVCTLTGAHGEAKVSAMICADREFPEAAMQLMLNGTELIVVPNACTWADIRDAGLKTRAFDNFVGIAMANYPGAHYGNSQGCTCAAWRCDGKSQETVIRRAGEDEQILVVDFDLDEIREFRRAESWRLEYRQRRLLC